MLSHSVILSLVGLAVASPLVPSTYSNGVLLVVNVTDTALDLDPPVHHTYINSIHIDSSVSLLGTGDKSQARIFYNNGTVDEYRRNVATLVSDDATPPHPFGLSFPNDPGSTTVSTGRLEMGAGQEGISISHFPAPFSVLFPGNFAICHEYVESYQQNLTILKQANPIPGPNGLPVSTLPKGCTFVTLFAECTKLNDLPADSVSSHEYAIVVNCYEKVY